MNGREKAYAMGLESKPSIADRGGIFWNIIPLVALIGMVITAVM